MEDEDRPGLSDAVANLPPESSDPHEWIFWLRGIPMAQRFQHEDQLIAMVKTRPRSEQETLLHMMKEIGFAISVMREKLRQAAKESGARFKAVASYEGKDDKGRAYLAEMVYRPDQKPQFGFLVHWFDNADGSPEFFEKLNTEDGTEIHPLATELAASGTVLFPSTYEEYGSDHELFLEIRNFINSFVVLQDPAFRTLSCCYVMLSWMHDRFFALPYLRARGDYGTGKSRLIQVVGSVCYRPILAGGATTASPIFRIIQRLKGTLIIDEADFSKSDLWEEIIKILNAGYTRGQGHVLRSERASEGEPFDVKAYDCYGPKILSTRKSFSDAALESRCFSHTMPLIKGLKSDIPYVLDMEFFGRAQRLRNQMLLWRLRNYNKVKVNSRERLEGLTNVEPRAVQIMQPVLACTSSGAIRKIVLEEAKKYALQMDSNRQEGLEGLAARAAVTYWDMQRKPSRLMLKSVTEFLQSRFDVKDIKSHRVSQLLTSVGVPKGNVGGDVHIFLTDALAERLSGQYNIERKPLFDAAPTPETATEDPQ
jgi:hypothetical protein